MESFYAVLIELQRLIVDSADEVSSRPGGSGKDRPGLGKFLGLREHESGEFLACERTGPKEEGAVKIFIQTDLAGIKSRKREFVALLEFFPVKVKCFRRFTARIAAPAIRQNNSPDVPEESCDFGHVY
jgi:hypothetical protein